MKFFLCLFAAWLFPSVTASLALFALARPEAKAARRLALWAFATSVLSLVAGGGAILLRASLSDATNGDATIACLVGGAAPALATVALLGASLAKRRRLDAAEPG